MRLRDIPTVALTAVFLTVIAASAALTAHAEVTGGKNLRVVFSGKLTPHSLPRQGTAPVRVAVGATIAATEAGTTPPALQRITIEINRHGRFDAAGLPKCSYGALQPSTTEDAFRTCQGALVGKGHFSAAVYIPQGAPFPSDGDLYAFNGTYKGKPAILAHIYGTKPVPTSYTIPFSISKGKGEYGTKLSAPMPTLESEWGYVTGLSLNLGRTFTHAGKRRSYLNAGCPAPKGAALASFNFARASFDFGSAQLVSTLTRSCRASG
jgi:hypothetical protein